MGMVVQHNISAMNANNAMGKNVSGLGKSTEKLSTGYSINRAADNAAGLAISEKMRSQIRGLTQATSNANDAISLIQTAEGGLQETEDILQRMRELSVQSANGTYTDEDREQIQYEVDALKSEVDRIASATEYNEMKLLDGSLAGTGSTTTTYGPRYGTVLTAGKTAAAPDLAKGTTVTSSIKGVTVKFTTGASGAGGENAAWDSKGTTLTINLNSGSSYNQGQIDELIKEAKVQKTNQGADIPDVAVTLGNGVITATKTNTLDPTAEGIRATSANVSLTAALITNKDGTQGYADQIKFTSNSYGADTRKITIKFDVGAGKEQVNRKSGNTTGETDYQKAGEWELHLSTGVEYSDADIEKLLAKEGLDYDVELTDNKAPDGDVKLFANTKANVTVTMGSQGTGTNGSTGVDGKGVYKDLVESRGEGLTFQIGANGVEDQRLTVNVENMSSAALGVDGVSVAKQDDANDAINKIDDAIKAVSTQRAKLGAVQNRLEHTVNSLNTSNENLSAAESQIRDTDMASEMIKYTKSNILQQASQSMLAQANQQPQGVLQLLG